MAVSNNDINARITACLYLLEIKNEEAVVFMSKLVLSK